MSAGNKITVDVRKIIEQMELDQGRAEKFLVELLAVKEEDIPGPDPLLLTVHK